MLQFVVGDRFSSLSQDKLYITYSDFIKKTLSQTPSAIEHPFYMPAQGLNQGCRQKISNENARLNNKKNSDVIIMQSKEAMHKSNQKNVLITKLRTIASGQYQSELIIDNDNEFLLDHFSGQHIPGMIFLEATRQLSIASWAALVDDDPDNVSMIINDIHCEYKKFAFPFCIHITVNIHPVGENYQVDINFTQNNDVVVRTFGTFKVVPRQKLSKMENLLMKKKSGQRSKQLLNLMTKGNSPQRVSQ
ncbi:MAG: hypothetical protein HRU22_12830 [Gammaproteobacteria bacterium]|nr:hypothetical protein [Gammaproteobacteria bacterium]